MSRKRMGELLAGAGPLNSQDVNEILLEQSGTHKRFGEVAIALGKCRPAQIWRAWASQLEQDYEPMDLRRIGVDAQVITALPASLAERYRIVPVRAVDDEMILATDRVQSPSARDAVSRALEGKRLRFVLAEESWITWALTSYYATCD